MREINYEIKKGKKKIEIEVEGKKKGREEERGGS